MNKSSNKTLAQIKRIFPKKLIRVSKNPISCLVITLIGLIFFGKYAPVEQGLLLASVSNIVNSQKLFFEQKDSFLCYVPQNIVLNSNSFRQASPTSLVKTEVLASISSGQISNTEDDKRKATIEYIVEKGDSLSSISDKFGISLETILWANNLTSKSVIAPGEKLTILPVSGVMHLVTNGESVGYLSEIYNVSLNQIAITNELEENKIFTGDLLIIPGGKKLVQTFSSGNTSIANSYFICPIPAPCDITQGLHWYNAIDFSNGECGEPVFASAGGQVQKTGFDYTAGNYVRILHPNKVVTFYGHLSKMLVSSGQNVSQGQVIGYIGNTGYTVGKTGCHVHFEVRGAKNPFSY